jgi:hypothetical protein
MINKIRQYLFKKKLGIIGQNIDVSLCSSFGNHENIIWQDNIYIGPQAYICLLYTSPSPRD